MNIPMPSFCACGMLIFLSLFLISFTPHCNGGNILVVPVDGSHWVNLKILLEELHARGHNLTVIRPSTSWYISEKSDLYTSITIEMDEDLEHFLDGSIEMQRERASLLNSFKCIKKFLSVLFQFNSLWSEVMNQILDDQNMVKILIASQYDLLLTDPTMPSGAVLAKYLKLPLVLYVRWIPRGEGHFVLTPSPLSYIPVPGSGLTDQMSFIQRIKNIFFYIFTLFQQNFIFLPIYDDMCNKYIEGGCDVISLLQQADIWLFRSDFVFEFPRPTMPNIVYIGGFQCKPARPLPAELEEFVQSAGKHGVIIMSLGTYVSALPKEIADEIVKNAISALTQHYRPSTLGNNTLIVDWMPQKDLLGHPQTKVFVAHGGTNGVQEAIYYGVPVLGIPLFFDQYDKLLRLQERGAGKIIRLADVNGHSFEQGLKEVIHQESYRLNIQRLSRLHRDQPITAMEKAVFWVEYVMRHKGARHLRTEAYKMPWYSYYSLDVLFILLSVVTVLLLSIVAVFRFLCCQRQRKIKTKQS
uniref:UDP-glucuronosyltransferase n=1 Tax=Neolamprologus brichardi TaxID=32507 RepID=A0A3Q4H4H0_NEOBR